MWAARLGFLLVLITITAASGAHAQTRTPGDPERGEIQFRRCVACHSLEPGRHKTGPSLAGMWGRRAGTAEGFGRYSGALKESEVRWTAETLDAWLKDPAAFIPGNGMTFPGIRSARDRRDLVAYLEKATSAGAPSAERGGPGMMGGMDRPMADLKSLPPESRVESLRYCGDTYRVATLDGEVHEFWEFNLRFKTDSSEKGPAKGTPVLIRAGMMGDRAFVIFSAPEEMAALIERKC